MTHPIFSLFKKSVKKFRSSGMQSSVVGLMVPDVAKNHNAFTLKDRSDAGKSESSETPARKPHVSQLNIVVSIGMMWKLDESVGKVVEALERRNMLKNTRIVLLSDNGAPTLNVGVWRNWGSNHPLRGVGGMATLLTPLFSSSTITNNMSEIYTR